MAVAIKIRENLSPEENFIIRRAIISDAYSIAKINVDTWKSTYGGIIQDAYLRTMSYKQFTQEWYKFFKINNNRFIYVAEIPEALVIGFIAGGPIYMGNKSYEGEIYALYIFQEYQHHGIGKRLFSTAVKELIRLNFHSMLLWVLKDNPYRAFYETLGGIFISEKEFPIGKNLYPIIAYGWRDLNGFLRQVTSEK